MVRNRAKVEIFMTPIPEHLLKLPWYPGHLAWLQANGFQPLHEPPPGVQPSYPPQRVYLVGQDLRGADFRRITFKDSCFKNANFEGANFEYATFRKSTFANANLKGANLEWALASECDFEGANLRCANLVRCSLRGANLNGADLSGTDAWDTAFDEATLINTKLSGIRTNSSFVSTPLVCEHEWVISNLDGWWKTCRFCKIAGTISFSTGKTADGKPFVILMTE